MAAKIRFLSAEDVRKCLNMPQAISAMREGFQLLSKREVVVPLRLHLDIPEYNGVELVKPVYAPALNQIGFKVISLFRNNHQLGLPLSHAVMLVFDAVTGIPLAVMDGNSLTAIRTGAAAGLATDLLARREARILAVFGAGLQARTQIEAIMTVRPLQKILIFDPNISKAQKLAEELRSFYELKVEVAKQLTLLKEADIISTVTTSDVPVFSDSVISSGVHINAMGSFKPDSREIPSETVRRAKVVVDQSEACLKEAGDLLIPIAEGIISNGHIHGEIGEIILGKKTGRESEQEITLFKSVGNAVQDLLAARLVLADSQQQNLGTELLL
jgi:ornithine cyclodeaminase/alanine dehydrogenase-like protein (mu-crystallin family)